ncbi:MAG: hypothetical protein AAFQ98_01305 [Bacteroidota bacterium]
MAQRTREQLKGFFKAHLIPTEENFADLIESVPNRTDDLLFKDAGSPFTLHLGGAISGREKILNLQRSAEELPTWSFELNPGGGTQSKGLSITNGAEDSLLFLSEEAGGLVGIGTIAPTAKLQVHSSSPVSAISYATLQNHVTLELGQSAAGGAGTLKLHTEKINQFAFIKAINQALYLDVAGGNYLFNADAGVSSTSPGQLQIRNGQGQTKVHLHTAGNTYFAGGKIGLGTNNPQEDIHLSGDVRGGHADGKLRLRSDHGYLDVGAGHANWMHFYTDRPKFYFQKGIYIDSGIVSAYSGQDLRLMRYDNEGITVKHATGYVGVGNSDPKTTLHVGTSAPTLPAWAKNGLLVSEGTDGLFVGLKEEGADRYDSVIAWGDNPTDSLRIFYNEAGASGKEVARFTANGRLGIGHTNPSHTLNVGGSGPGVGLRVGGYLTLGQTSLGANAYLSINALLSHSQHTGSDIANRFSPNHEKGTGMVMIQNGGGSGDINFYGIDWKNSFAEKDYPRDFTPVMQLKTNGRVGIGRINPAVALDINGAIRGGGSGGSLKIQTEHGLTEVGARNSVWSHFETDRDDFYFNKPVHVLGGVFSAYSNHSLSLQTNKHKRLTVHGTNGNVGIANSNPETKLHIGTGNMTVRSWMDKGVLFGDSTDGMYVGLKVNSNNRADSVIAWGDDSNDLLRFYYTGSGKPDKEVARFESTGTMRLYGELRARSIKTQLHTVRATKPIAFHTNTWTTIPGLSKTISLTQESTVLINYLISAHVGGGHFLSRIEIDGVVVAKYITGNTSYYGNQDTYFASLAAGSHTIVVKFRTNHNHFMDPKHDYHDARMQVLVLGSNE